MTNLAYIIMMKQNTFHTVHDSSFKVSAILISVVMIHLDIAQFSHLILLRLSLIAGYALLNAIRINGILRHSNKTCEILKCTVTKLYISRRTSRRRLLLMLSSHLLLVLSLFWSLTSMS